MITKDIQKFAVQHWNTQLDSVTNLSKRKDNENPLVESGELLYDFDQISKSLFPCDSEPTSVDALSISDNCLNLIEFKSGFRQRITRDTFDDGKGTCPHLKDVCKEYWDLFFENQKKKIKELVFSIRFKAIESYITLEKFVFPCCDARDDIKTHIKLTVVVDDNGVDSMEDTLAGLAGVEADNNCYTAIRKSLTRLVNRKDICGNPFFYDSIEVMSSQDFFNRIQTGIYRGIET